MSDQDFENPILENLNSKMRCGILTNAKGEILIVHDFSLAGTADYIEYDPEEQSFSIIYDDGRMQELGLKFDKKIKANLAHGSEVTLALIENKTIKSSQNVIFLIRNN